MDPLWILLLGIVVVVGGILAVRLHPFLALLLGALTVATLTPQGHLERYAVDKGMSVEAAKSFAEEPTGKRLGTAFGTTCGKIGILIALAAIIGKCLLESGAADRIIRSAFRLVGERRAPIAFLGSGFTLGTPVFFDTVFYLMIPLGKALAFRTGRNYGLYVMAIIAGASMAHSLVPPTPGPLFVADKLGIDIGAMMLGGLVVGSIAVASGYVYMQWINKRFPVPLRESGNVSMDDLKAIAERDERELPPLGLSLLPILLPVVLITGGTIFNVIQSQAETVGTGMAAVGSFFATMGNPNIALGIAAAVALIMTVNRVTRRERPMTQLVREALGEAGIIILITAAGGAFGGVLQQCGVGWRLREIADGYQLAILPLAFVLTAVVRMAQGSATVAMITTVGLVAAIITPDQLPFHPVYVALAIGCGSKPFPWMNDSGFWVICQISGLTLPETIRCFSFLLTTMGIAGLGATLLLAWLFPMV